MIRKNIVSHLRVDKQIVSLLSKSTYTKSFPSAIRELISNAYDADALSVKIDFDDSLSYVELRDDGNGMTLDEFQNFLTIAGTKASNKVRLTKKYKRSKIGQFGVGFLATFPFCESLDITTTVENSTDIIKATIPTNDYFDNRELEAVDEVPIPTEIITSVNDRLAHYTIIKLNNPTWLAKQYFSKAEKKKVASIHNWEPIDKFKWELQEDLPINLNKKSKYFSSFKYKEPIPITVFINGKELFRNDYLDFALDQGEVTIHNVKCKYIFTTNYESLKPYEARGIKFRVNNVGIGPRTDLHLKRDRGFSRLHWITGEVMLSEEIKLFLNVGRDGFISSPITDDISEFFAEKLRSIANDIETIAVAEKAIKNISVSTKSDASKPQKEVLEDNLKKLESKGFRVVERSPNSKEEDVIVDKESKTVYVSAIGETKNINETINIDGKEYGIIFDSWNIDSEESACRMNDNNTISVNRAYPLFKSKNFGQLFKRLHILLLITNNSSRNKEDFYKQLNSDILKEFKSFV